MPATRQRQRAERTARSPARRRNGGGVSPHRLFLLIGFLLAALFTTGLRWGLHWAWIWAYLLAINLTTAVLYGYDKRAAIVGGLRVPERVLHGFAFAGGTPAAYLSQRIFRHKTIKSKFRIWFIAIFVMQVL